MFYDDLLPYGEWIEADPGMMVWRPRHVQRDWQPYSAGRWVWTRHGWYWLSNEPFGWAVFHYGRWSTHPRFGWVWHPGRVWGPAWVEWRYSEAYVGWSPLPPVAIFHTTFGIRFTRHWVAPVTSWCFIPYGSFGATIYRNRLLTQGQIRRVLGTTRRGRSTIIERDVIINRGVDRSIVEQRGSIRVDRYDVRSGITDRSEGIRSGRIETYRPEQDRQRKDAVGRSSRERDPNLRAPRQNTSREESQREFTRPQQERKERSREIKRPSTRNRQVAPTIRTQPKRRSATNPTRSSGRTSGRKRDG